nr:molecular chaperone HtpG [Ktedonobacterales bacterium]
DHIVVPIFMASEGAEGQEQSGDEQVNRASALWTRPKADISPTEYAEFYRNITHDFDDPLLTIHNRMEGTLEYTLLLFVPTEAPFDLWQRERHHGVKLYVRRVFILEDTQRLLPSYLRFVRGIIDSNDLPLNVSREILQQHRIIDQMRTSAVKKLLGALGDLAKNDATKYQTFWDTFGRAFKEGLAEDPTNQDVLIPLLRFTSTIGDGPAENVALDDYVARMPTGQQHIYYLIAENFAAANESPLLEIFRQRGVEVLLLTDPIDAIIESSLTNYAGKPFQSVARGNVDLAGIETPATTEDQPEPQPAAGEEVLTRLKTALGDAVKAVRASTRLTTSPACLVNDERDLDPAFVRLLKANGQMVPSVRPILEINLSHPVVRRIADETDATRFDDWAQLLYDQSVLSRGDQLEHPARFVTRLNALLAPSE